MYALFAYIGGEWGIAGIDEHEECAVLFIDMTDKTFGEGTAFVAKLPDKSNHSPTADAAEHHATMASMQEMLKGLEDGNIDVDAALQNLNRRNK